MQFMSETDEYETPNKQIWIKLSSNLILDNMFFHNSMEMISIRYEDSWIHWT